MNYQELITRFCNLWDIAAADIAIVRIDHPANTIIVIDHLSRKFVGPFPDPDPEPFENQDPPKPKRMKAVKRVGN